MVPQRIQRKRTKGWKMPPNTRYVGRSTIYGNPFAIGDALEIRTPEGVHVSLGKIRSNEEAVAYFRAFWVSLGEWGVATAERLRGMNLACYCPIDKPCHADVLLELANSCATPPRRSPRRPAQRGPESPRHRAAPPP